MLVKTSLSFAAISFHNSVSMSIVVGLTSKADGQARYTCNGKLGMCSVIRDIGVVVLIERV